MVKANNVSPEAIKTVLEIVASVCKIICEAIDNKVAADGHNKRKEAA